MSAAQETRKGIVVVSPAGIYGHDGDDDDDDDNDENHDDDDDSDSGGYEGGNDFAIST